MKRTLSFILALVLLIGLILMQVFATEGTQEVEVAHEHEYAAAVTDPTCTEQGYTTYTCACGDSYVDDYVDDTGHSYEKGICVGCGAKEPQLVPLSCSITPIRGEFNNDTGALLDSSIYGCVIGYKLKKGHTLFINNTDYVFAVRKLFDGNYNTLVRSASSATFTATEDMTVAIRIRKPDQSALTDAELASIVLYDTQFSMKDVPGYSHRFTVEAETIEGGTSTTRAAIFLPESYTDNGTPTRLIIMTNGRNGYLNDCVWNANKVDDVGVMRHYMENGYAVLVVDNTAGTVNGAPDWGNPQLVDSYWKAYEYVQANLNVEKCFSIHSRSMGTFAAMRMMREHPELVKCALMCGAVLSLQSRFSNDPAFLAQRYGFDDATGGTWEADKVVGYDPYTDVDGLEYDLPPTFWMLAEADATGAHLTTIEKIENHGNDVTRKIYTETDHSGVCRLNIQECRDDALAYLEAHQENDAPHRYCAWTITKEANCGENGEMRRECADCNHYETLEIPMLYEHVIVEGETCCAICGNSFIVTREKVTLLPGHFNDKDGSWTSSDIYGHIVNYELKVGHTLSISDENYVFAVRVLNNGSYSTLLKEATADSFTADEDMIVAVRVRKPDMSPMTEEELISVVLYDTFYEEHTHTYTPVVTEPTCTEQGYTTYTCACGDSYVGKYVDASGHSYENGTCTVCGNTCGPVITQQPESISAERLDEVIVSAAAQGEDLVYRWYYRCVGETDFRVSNSTGDTFRTVMSSDLHGCEVYCVITDGAGNSATSDVAVLSLSSAEEPATPPARIPGDINGDGVVNNKDLIRLFRYLSGWDVEIY